MFYESATRDLVRTAERYKEELFLDRLSIIRARCAMLQESKTKIPDVLVEHNSVMRGAIPCLPVPLAWFCLVWNFLLPGTGTINLNVECTTILQK